MHYKSLAETAPFFCVKSGTGFQIKCNRLLHVQTSTFTMHVLACRRHPLWTLPRPHVAFLQNPPLRTLCLRTEQLPLCHLSKRCSWFLSTKFPKTKIQTCSPFVLKVSDIATQRLRYRTQDLRQGLTLKNGKRTKNGSVAGRNKGNFGFCSSSNISKFWCFQCISTIFAYTTKITKGHLRLYKFTGHGHFLRFNEIQDHSHYHRIIASIIAYHHG